LNLKVITIAGLQCSTSAKYSILLDEDISQKYGYLYNFTAYSALPVCFFFITPLTFSQTVEIIDDTERRSSFAPLDHRQHDHFATCLLPLVFIIFIITIMLKDEGLYSKVR